MLQQADPFCILRHVLSAQIALIVPSALFFSQKLDIKKRVRLRALFLISRIIRSGHFLIYCSNLGLQIKRYIITVA